MGSLRAWSLTQVSSVLSSPQFPTLLMPHHFTMSSGALWVQCENHSTWVIRCFESICQGHVRQETEALTLSFKCQLSEGTLLLRLSYLLKSHMSWVFIADATRQKLKKGHKGPDEALGRREHRCIATYCHSSSSELDLQACTQVLQQLPGEQRIKAIWRLLCWTWDTSSDTVVSIHFTLEGKERVPTSGMMSWEALWTC